MKPAINHQYLGRLVAHILHQLGSKTGGPSRGFTAIEALVALAILGLIAATYMSGVMTALRSASLADERSTAQSLAQSQMEYVQTAPYDDVNDPPTYQVDPNLTGTGYTIEVSASRLDPEGDGPQDDDGLQEITVTVKADEEIIYTLQGTKWEGSGS
ncbi:MAG: type IV pilus modification PilV family protein [Chloroflexota bacterium]